MASHGRTVRHWTEGSEVRGTLQLGQPAWIAEATGLPVVADFQPRDIAAGGQGAPPVSLVDLLWLRGRPGTPVALNLGSVANLTAPDGTAFDTGPACALIDAAVREFSGGRRAYDVDGALAARGHRPRAAAAPAPRRAVLRAARAEDHGQGTVPRRLSACRVGRVRGSAPGGRRRAPHLLTARTVAEATRAVRATEVIASGGGTRNPTLTRMLGAELAGVPLRLSDELGLPAEAKEAYAFAVLGFLTVRGLPGTDPVSSGARGLGTRVRWAR